MNRRIFLKFVASSAASLALIQKFSTRALAATLPFLKSNDAAAVAQNYYESSAAVPKDKRTLMVPNAAVPHEKQNCKNCALYLNPLPDVKGGGKCALFPANAVNDKGWCKMWNMKKPA